MDSSEALMPLYSRIKQLTAEGAVVFDKIRYVEQYGELPKEKVVHKADDTSIADLKYRKRKLIDHRSKAKNKLLKVKEPNRRQALEQTIEIKTMEIKDIDSKIADLNG